MRRGARTLTRCVAAISLVIGVAACGGGNGDADRAATTIATAATDAERPAPDETVIGAEVSATVRVIVDRLGPDAAFAAVVVALDAGYGADQIAQHASVLTSEGTIPGVAPTGPPTGVFATATANGQGLRLAAEKTPEQALANLKAKAYDEDTVETLLGTVLFLAGVGYSAEQILDGLLFGEQRYARTALQGLEGEGPDYSRCILLAGQDGTLITPAGPSTVGGRAGSCAAGVRDRMEVLVVIDGKWVEAATTTTNDNAATEPAAVEDEPDPDGGGSGELGANPFFPGPDGSMGRQSITLTVEGDTARLTVDVDFTTAMSYSDGNPVCFDDFTMTSGASTLTVDEDRISGTTELVVDFDVARTCPQTEEIVEEDDIGVPYSADITGQIVDGTFTGSFEVAGIVVPFTAAIA